MGRSFAADFHRESVFDTIVRPTVALNSFAATMLKIVPLALEQFAAAQSNFIWPSFGSMSDLCIKMSRLGV